MQLNTHWKNFKGEKMEKKKDLYFHLPIDLIFGLIMMFFVVMIINEEDKFYRGLLVIPVAIFYMASKIAYMHEHNKVLQKIMEKKEKV
jgi:hypothetical protein